VTKPTRQSSGKGRPMRPQFSLDQPVEGYYRRRLVSGGPWVGVRIWFGLPADPDTGELLDRSPRWQAEQTGKVIAGDDAIQSLWVSCCREPITRKEYEFLIADAAWCRENAPDEPASTPSKPIDLNNRPSLF